MASKSNQKSGKFYLLALETPPHQCPPMGLMVVSQALTGMGVSTWVGHLDSRQVRNELRWLLERKPLGVGFWVAAGPALAPTVKMSLALRNAGVPVVWGGPLALTAPEVCGSFDAADLVVSGAGEVDTETWWELLMGSKPGTACQAHTAAKWDKNSCEEILYPDPSVLARPEDYLIPRPPFKRVAALPLTRGCRRRCAFCAGPVVTRGRVSYDTDSILKAAKFWENRHGAQAFEFADDELLDHAPHIPELVEELGLPFFAQLHARSVTEEVSDWLFSAGCEGVKMGAESGSDTVLRRLAKGAGTGDIRGAVQKLIQREIPVILTFMVGIPEESPGELSATVEMAYELASMSPKVLCLFGHFTPYPGTRLWKKSLDGGFLPPQTVEGWARLDPGRPQVPWVPHKDLAKLTQRLNEQLFFSRVMRQWGPKEPLTAVG